MPTINSTNIIFSHLLSLREKNDFSQTWSVDFKNSVRSESLNVKDMPLPKSSTGPQSLCHWSKLLKQSLKYLFPKFELNILTHSVQIGIFVEEFTLITSPVKTCRPNHVFPRFRQFPRWRCFKFYSLSPEALILANKDTPVGVNKVHTQLWSIDHHLDNVGTGNGVTMQAFWIGVGRKGVARGALNMLGGGNRYHAFGWA